MDRLALARLAGASAPEAEETRAGPADAGDLDGDLGERGVAAVPIEVAIFQDQHAMLLPLPFADQHRSGLGGGAGFGKDLAVLLILALEAFQLPPRRSQQLAVHALLQPVGD